MDAVESDGQERPRAHECVAGFELGTLGEERCQPRVDPDEDLRDLLALGYEEAVLAHLGYELGKDLLALALVQREHVGGLFLEEIDDAIGAATGVLEVLDVPRRDGECLGHPCPPACFVRPEAP